MLIAIAGKTNVGKSTFFNACTLGSAEVSNRTFTTIRPNVGVTHVRTGCACKLSSISCGKCKDGVRFVPVKIIDIAGLVPDAHLGKGLGNQFLSDIMEASAIVHVIDAAGATDINGNPTQPGTHDPLEDVDFFLNELDYWILGIAKKALKSRVELKKEEFIAALSKQLSGLGIKQENIEYAINKTNLKSTSDDSKFLEFAGILREKSKPVLIAANKIDLAPDKNIENLKDIAVLCSSEAEYALRRAADKGIIDYIPGNPDFNTVKSIDEKQKNALEFIRNNILKKFGSTGVQKVVDKAVFDALEMIVVYPVENEARLSDKKGNVLPDAFLMKRGSTAIDLAYKVHEDIGKKFIAAIDCKSGRHVSANYELKDGDIISIKSGR